jgi:hypothetical protein
MSKFKETATCDAVTVQNPRFDGEEDEFVLWPVPVHVLGRVECLGVAERLAADGRIVLRPASVIEPELMAGVREHRDAIQALLRLRLADAARLSVPQRQR